MFSDYIELYVFFVYLLIYMYIYYTDFVFSNLVLSIHAYWGFFPCRYFVVWYVLLILFLIISVKKKAMLNISVTFDIPNFTPEITRNPCWALFASDMKLYIKFLYVINNDQKVIYTVPWNKTKKAPNITFLTLPKYLQKQDLKNHLTIFYVWMFRENVCCAKSDIITDVVSMCAHVSLLNIACSFISSCTNCCVLQN